MAYGGIRGAVGFSLVVTLPVTIVHRYKKTRVPLSDVWQLGA